MIARRWWPPLAWAALILIGTSLPGTASPPLHGRDRYFHFLAYMVLGFLTVGAAAIQRRPLPLIAVIAALLLFAALDEWHQQLIPGRVSDPGDWRADALGVVAGSVTAWVLPRRTPA